MKTTKALSIIFFLFVIFTCKSQITITANGGEFKDLITWRNGFLGMIEIQKGPIMSMSRLFQYFDNSGRLIWNTKIDTYSYSNHLICNKESNEIYIINKPNNKTILFNIIQIDINGKLKEQQITYTDKFQALIPIAKKLNAVYYESYNEGIIAILTADDRKYHVIKINNDLTTEYQEVDFEYNKKSFENKQVSKPKFVLNNDMFCLLQSKINGTTLSTKTIKLSFEHFNVIDSSVNNINLKNYNFSSKFHNLNLEHTSIVYNDINHTYTEAKRGSLYAMPSLGSFIDFKIINNELKAFCCISKDNKPGLLTFNFETNGETNDIEHENEIINEVNIDNVFYNYYYIKDKEIVFISELNKSFDDVITSLLNEDAKTYKTVSTHNSLILFLTGQEKLSIKTDNTFNCLILNDEYYNFTYTGKMNGLGNYNKAIITKL
jgi:hypothetical protein